MAADGDYCASPGFERLTRRCCIFTGWPVVSRSQAATAGAAANERYQTSAEAYRIKVADEEYPKQLEKLCGPNGVGGPLGDFPVKRRKAKDGGDWTFARSCELRPMSEGSIYAQAKRVQKFANNKYSPLHN